jgi:AraC-like DNA-binding protein
MGIHATHTPGFAIDRSHDPYGTCLILAFRSEAVIETLNGLETAQPGDCIIHSADFRQYHTAVTGATEGYSNDWIHIHPAGLTPLVDALKLPFNRLIHTRYPEILTPFIRRMQAELMTPDSYSDAVIRNQIEGMLLGVARSSAVAVHQEKQMTTIERYYYHSFCNLRETMLNECFRNFTLAELASQVNLGPERFAVLYRKFFKVTPYGELIEVRLIRAKTLLLNSSMSVQEIARECGWHDNQYFSRLFKRKIGLSPSMYRLHFNAV